MLTLALACSVVVLALLSAFGILGPGPYYQCGTDSLRIANKTYEVSKKYKRLLVRYPNRTAVSTEFLRDEKTGLRTKTWGILVQVSKEIDQDTVPPKSRIPDELEGVPVQIILASIAQQAEDYVGGGIYSGKNPHAIYAWEVWQKYQYFFREYPFSTGSLMWSLPPGGEPGTVIFGIEVGVTDKVHNLGLSPTKRIPDCLDDVPVKIKVGRN